MLPITISCISGSWYPKSNQLDYHFRLAGMSRRIKLNTKNNLYRKCWPFQRTSLSNINWRSPSPRRQITFRRKLSELWLNSQLEWRRDHLRGTWSRWKTSIYSPISCQKRRHIASTSLPMLWAVASSNKMEAATGSLLIDCLSVQRWTRRLKLSNTVFSIGPLSRQVELWKLLPMSERWPCNRSKTSAKNLESIIFVMIGVPAHNAASDWASS